MRINGTAHDLDGPLGGTVGVVMVWERKTSEDSRFVLSSWFKCFSDFAVLRWSVPVWVRRYVKYLQV